MKISLSLGAAVAATALLASSVYAGSTKDVIRGGAIGAAGGAVVGAVVPGLSVGEGALIGGAGGAVVGALSKDKKGRKLYRDSRGNRYWVDKKGRRHYQR